jgi:hypothetical protein
MLRKHQPLPAWHKKGRQVLMAYAKQILQSVLRLNKGKMGGVYKWAVD